MENDNIVYKVINISGANNKINEKIIDPVIDLMTLYISKKAEKGVRFDTAYYHLISCFTNSSALAKFINKNTTIKNIKLTIIMPGKDGLQIKTEYKLFTEARRIALVLESKGYKMLTSTKIGTKILDTYCSSPSYYKYSNNGISNLSIKTPIFLHNLLKHKAIEHNLSLQDYVNTILEKSLLEK